MLTNDRVDHIVTLQNEHALVEVKKSQATDSAKYDATQQVIRYCRNYNPIKKTDLYCLFFPKYRGSMPTILSVDYVSPKQLQRSQQNKERALKILRMKRTSSTIEPIKEESEDIHTVV